jgi:hypothetical protein
MTTVAENTMAFDGVVLSNVDILEDNASLSFIQAVTEYTEMVRKLKFEYIHEHKVTTKHVLSIPEFINTDELINTFISELTNACNYCMFTRIPLNHLRVELNKHVDSPYRTHCDECITQLYKHLDLLISSHMGASVYTKKNKISINFDDEGIKQCIAAIGFDQTSSKIRDRFVYHKLTISWTLLKRPYESAILGWEIEFSYS